MLASIWSKLTKLTSQRPPPSAEDAAVAHHCTHTRAVLLLLLGRPHEAASQLQTLAVQSAATPAGIGSRAETPVAPLLQSTDSDHVTTAAVVRA